MSAASTDHAHAHDRADAREAFPDEDLPEGAVFDGALRGRDHDEAFDFVVVGSGAAGATAAHRLVEAGFSVAIVEEGPWIKTRDVRREALAGFRGALRDSGLQVMKGRSYVPMIQGRCVGGSTLVNSAIVWRTPEDVLDDWAVRFGLGGAITPGDLAPHFDALERDLSARPVGDDALGENNGLFLRTAGAAGYAHNRMKRYERGCRGSGRCFQGCPNAAKQGTSITYVPWALRLGARIFTSCPADHVVVAGDRAVGVVARAASGRTVRLRARHGVIVAASTVQTPNLLRRSGLRAPAIGRHFQAHPGFAVAAQFERPIDMSFGATQGAESVHFRATERFKLETIALPPELAAARIPGVGKELSSRMAALGHVAIWAAQIRCSAEGTVRATWGGKDEVRYTPLASDMEIARKAAVVLCRLMFDAGAREVWPGIFGLPTSMTSPDELGRVENASLDPRAWNMVATHLFGAARMGADPRTSAVGLDFATHEARALYVLDSSIFPTNLGVNPQHSIMAIARLAATRIAERARGTVSRCAAGAL